MHRKSWWSQLLNDMINLNRHFMTNSIGNIICFSYTDTCSVHYSLSPQILLGVYFFVESSMVFKFYYIAEAVNPVSAAHFAELETKKGFKVVLLKLLKINNKFVFPLDKYTSGKEAVSLLTS